MNESLNLSIFGVFITFSVKNVWKRLENRMCLICVLPLNKWLVSNRFQFHVILAMKQSVSEQTAAKFKVPFRKGCHQFHLHHANGNCNCIVVEQNFSVMTFKYSSPSSTYQTIRGDDANPKAMPKRLKLKLPISSLGNYVKKVFIT